MIGNGPTLPALLLQVQWLLDAARSDLPAGSMTPEKREELATILERTAELIRDIPTIIDGP